MYRGFMIRGAIAKYLELLYFICHVATMLRKHIVVAKGGEALEGG